MPYQWNPVFLPANVRFVLLNLRRPFPVSRLVSSAQCTTSAIAVTVADVGTCALR
jgi:hypothetical protein